MDSEKISESTIEANGEKFTKSTYNGVSVIIDSNGYYNASKICRDNGVKFDNISRNDYWKRHLRCLSGVLKTEQTTLIRKRLDLPNEAKGYYIHKKLVNFLCIHVNDVYAIKVGQIMDLIDERAKREKTSLEDEIKILEGKLHEESIRATHEDTKHRYLTVFKRRDGLYQVSGNQCKRSILRYEQFDRFMYRFTFPASMNIRMDLRRDRVTLTGNMTADLDGLLAAIRSYKPLEEKSSKR